MRGKLEIPAGKQKNLPTVPW